MNLTDKQIDEILNSNLTEEFWILQLGIGYIYEDVQSNARYSLPYNEYGIKLWFLLRREIYDLLCIENKPKEWVSDLIEGDIRNLIIGIVSAITAKYDVGLGIAIPIVALLLKSDIKSFCKINYSEKENVDIKYIIKNKKLDIKKKKNDR